MFQAYDVTSCDMSCDCNVTCLFIITKKKKKRNIKPRKIDKRKMLVSKHSITTNITGVLCAEERWEEKNGARLLISEQLDDQE